ncbi:MAG: HPr family phosphocarrier protein [Gammaproteobacteria bacterium]|nr:HPr family phosphocarrier protein [Gammaproteobacteria bacterium]
MLQQTTTIVNKLGLHARAAAKFVTQASLFDSEINVKRNNQNINGKSIMGIMMLAAAKGTEIELIIDGADEKQAMQSLLELIENRFGEAE